MGSYGRDISAEYTQLTVEIDASAAEGLHDLSVATILRTVWAITNHVYTGNDTVEVLQYALEGKNLVPKALVNHRVQGSMSFLEIAASEEEVKVLHPRSQESDNDSSTITPLQLVKRTALIFVDIDNVEFGLENYTDVIDKNQNLLCAFLDKRRCQVFLQHPKTKAWKDTSTYLADTIEQVAHSTFHNANSAINCLQYLGSANRLRILQTTETSATTADATLADIIVQQAKLKRDRLAIDAWDGRFTYEELFRAALCLATVLQSNKISLGERIPLCMKKSKWTIAAMFGIFLAGGTCVPLDINSPPKRLLALMERLKARLVVTDQIMSSAFADMDIEIVIYPSNPTEIGDLQLPLPKISPSSAAFVYFTSGSTGTPKGVVLEHGNLYAAIREVAKGYGLNERARVFQYAAYVFDVSMGDIFGTLMNGGCLCIPSEEARMDDPAASVNAFAATHACFTNTVVSYIQPSKVPTLQHLFVGGEALDKAQVIRWSPHLDLNVVYGTTESLIWDSLAVATDLLSDHNNIGRPIGPCLWVVDVHAPDQLRPIGAIGEILIEGPLLARGYMDDPNTTAAKFIQAPTWLQHLRQNSELRCYRTGDLGCRNADGTISFVGRADTQVKIRGQRVELGEIEHSIVTIDSSLEYVAVDAVKLATSNNAKMLAAFLYRVTPTQDSISDILSMDESSRKMFRRLRADLTNWLPGHMVPILYFPIAKVPRAVTGKLDRITLRRWAEEMSAEQLTPYYLEDVSMSRAPETVEEKIIQQAWAKTMGVAATNISAEDHFFQSGGNSIKAMELAATVRDQGRSISVAMIFQNPRLSSLATAIGEAMSTLTKEEYSPFSLISTRVDTDWCIQEAAQACGISREMVEDIYPTTPMQEGLMATSARRTNTYYCQLVFKIPEGIDLARFKSAWESLITAQPILRTRICIIPTVGSMQVVTRPDVAWRTSTSLVSTLQHIRESPMTYGTELSRYAIVYNEDDGCKYFIWSGHHAIYDGWSQPMMFREICQYYLGGTVTAQVPYRNFIQYLDKSNLENDIEFWTSQFPDTSETFPKLRTASHTPRPDQSLTLPKLAFAAKAGSEITAATFIQAAWALVIARHLGSNDAVFGLTLSGRDAPVNGVTSMLGPTITTVPLRVNLDNTMTVAEYLQEVQALVAEVRLHQHTGLQTIRRLSPEASSAVDFQTLVVIHPQGFGQDRTLSDIGLELLQVEETDTRDLALTIQCILDVDTVSVRAQFDEQVIDVQQLKSLLYRLEHVLSQLTEESTVRTIYDLDLMSQYDIDRLSEWNRVMPSTASTCIHTLVEKQTLATPDAQAICGFDRDYTYSELDTMATDLASHLTSLGVCQESRVVLCFSKSSWPIIAMLAVLKSGGACVSVNPDHPLSRLQELCKDVDAEVVLCDEFSVGKFENCVTHVVAVTTSLMTHLKTTKSHYSTSVLPSNASFVVYTSGSTGKPKGSVLEHQALCTSLLGIAQKSGIGPSSRTLQFSAYTFDAHILEIFGTLLAGGCVCVISEDERMNRLADTIRKRKVNWSLLTPTVARLLKPEEVSTMETLILSGEPLAEADVRQWANHLRLLNGLGPSECSILACLTDTLNSESAPANIGHALGCNLWITERNRPDRLTPIGAIGELTIEGPILGREYVNRAKATAAAFITNPGWSQGTAERPRRFYRTGDLAKFNMDGSVTFIGRADSQVKINGQRVELGEIEHNLKICGCNFAAVVVDVLSIASRADSQNLVAFVTYHEKARELHNEGPFLVMSSDMREDLVKAQEMLTAKLPRYMVPSLYLPIQDLPVSTSGKLERKTLRTWTSLLSADDLALYYLKHNVGPSEPTTEKEEQLLHLWSQVLKIPEKTIGVGENFFQLGGDSVAAMQLIAAARAANLSLTVTDVFQFPKLTEMAQYLDDAAEKEDLAPRTEPFDLIRDQVDDLAAYIHEAAQECQIESGLIEDIYPCTSIQEALMAVSAHRPQAYTHRAAFVLHPTLDLSRFRCAWETLVSRHAIFRTRIIVQQEVGAIQIVSRNKLSWRSGSSLDEYLQQDRQQPFEYGSELSRFALVPYADSIAFVWTVHHATYDGWSLARVFEEVYRHLREEAVEPVVPYRDFVQYLTSVDQDKCDEFWRGQFNDHVENFPRLPSSQYMPKPRQRKTAVMQVGSGVQSKTTSTTMATIVLAAWALVTAPHTDGQQAHFGLALSGRDAAVTGITEIMGPTMTTVPMRICLLSDETVSDFLERIQTQVAQVRNHQHISRQRIRRLSPQARAAIDFQNLVVVQTVGNTEIEAPLEALGMESVKLAEDEFLDLALTTECIIRANAIQVNIQYDNHVVADSQVDFLLQQMEHAISVLQRSNAHDGTLLRDVDLVSAFDLERIHTWHGVMPQPVEATVHGLFEQQVSARPHAIALSGFDGEYTYLELEEIANTLALQLAELGAGAESQIILCFNKSSSPIVAMLAVLKSGAACVSVNPQHPKARLLDICHDAAPTVILCDQEYAATFKGAAPHIVAFSIHSSTQQKISNMLPKLQPVSPYSAAFTVYTSGTTGVPKGIVLEHNSLCTSFKLNGRICEMSSETRALQFSAYTFDLHIFEIFCTLAHGGRVCVISEGERTGELVETINARHINWALLTPTVARLIPEGSVPNLKTLLLAGEPITRIDIHQWVGHVRLLNMYGPAECSIFVCGNSSITRDTDPSDIGNESSCHIWITDRENPDRLMPVGAIGEMLVEGVVVGRGYLNRPDATAKAFITDPLWSRNGSGSRRFYRTGDLARLTSDGRISFLGRADTQVKIRGQRVELSEIEYQARVRLPSDSKVVVELVQPEGPRSGPTVAAFIHLRKFAQPSSTCLVTSFKRGEREEFQKMSAELQRSLTEFLPEYMVPVAYIPISTIPTLPSGKTDRALLRHEASSLTLDDMCLRESAHEKRQPTNSIERELQAVWSRVLNIPVTDIGIEDTFHSLGGDSITAMQIVADFRRRGIKVSISAILGKRTITAIGPTCVHKTSTTNHSPNTSGDKSSFGLLPLQKLYLAKEGQHATESNQSCLIRVRKAVKVDQVHAAWDVLVERHAMLRARFERNSNGEWQQKIASMAVNSYRFTNHVIDRLDQIALHTRRSTQCLNVVTGPVFSVDWFDVGSEDPAMFLVAHHLVIDSASWHIIGQDFEELLERNTLPVAKSLSFQQWRGLQESQELSESLSETAMPTILPASNYNFWQVPTDENTQAAVTTESFQLSTNATSQLLDEDNTTCRTHPLDIFLGLLTLTFRQIFVERDAPTVLIQSQGRQMREEELLRGVDITNTVGWFSTMYPVQVPITTAMNPAEAIRIAKDQRYAVIKRGCPNNDVLASEGHKQAEIVVTFIEAWCPLKTENGLLELESRIQHQDSQNQSNVSRSALMNVKVEVCSGLLTCTFSLCEQMAHLPRVREWIRTYQDVLSETALSLTQQLPLRALSDFPLLDITYGELDDLMTRQLPLVSIDSVRDVQDIYPCTAMQEGILLSQQKDGQLYRIVCVWEHRDSGMVDHGFPDRMKAAWQSTVNRHSSLRTEIVPVVGRYGNFLQIVLRHPTAKFTLVDQRVSGAVEIADLPSRNEDCAWSHLPHLSIYFTHDGRAACRLELSHVVADGASVDLLINDLLDQLIGRTSAGDTMDFARFVEYERNQSHVEGVHFWSTYLKGVEACHLPVLKQEGPLATGFGSYQVSHAATANMVSFCRSKEVTPAALLQTAWAIVLGTFSNSDDVCLGYFASDRDAPLEGIENSIGLFISTQVCRVRLSGSMHEVLHRVQQDILSGLEHRHCPLATIHNALELGATPLFNTCLTVRRGLPQDKQTKVAQLIDLLELPDQTEYAVALHATVSPTEMACDFTYRRCDISPEYAQSIGGSLETVIQFLTNAEDQPVSAIDRIGASDRAQLEQWTSQEPSAVAATVHGLVEMQVRARPNDPATSGFDGDYTYAQIDHLSTRLAVYLTQLGLKIEARVVLCFSKSTWPAIAMLAVLKAGGVCVSVNPEHPRSRLHEIHEDLEADIVLCDRNSTAHFAGLATHIVIVDQELLSQMQIPSDWRQPDVSPRNAAFVVYTSGTTGKPKGSILEHQCLCTSMAATAQRTRMDAHTRTLQFSAYTFDAHILEIFGTWIVGGCVCITSEDERMGALTDVINARKANWSLLTPTVTRMISPEKVPTLKTLVLAGEPLARHDVWKWAGQVHAFNGIGPSECSILACLSDLTMDSDPLNIGFAIGCHLWITDHTDPDRLVPIGCVGEILIEGPIVGRGYINRLEATASAFIVDPAWSCAQPSRGPKIPRRFYRTGDLGRFNLDGSITFIGRRDTQVKIRGQRVELSEIEHNIELEYPQLRQVVVEIGAPSCKGKSQILAAFLEYDNQEQHAKPSDKQVDVLSVTSFMKQELAFIQQSLRRTLPLYMVPKLFIPVSRMPRLATGKLDRKTMRQWLVDLSLDQFDEYALNDASQTRLPSTPAEQLLQRIWARVLSVPVARVGAEDHFFQSGGDSARAMQLISNLREARYTLSIAQIFRTPRLCDLAAALQELNITAMDSKLTPFTLMKPQAEVRNYIDDIALICQVDLSAVEDLYPATPMQESLVAVSAHQAGAYSHQMLFKLPDTIDLTQFKTAWQTVVAVHPILRTRIVTLSGTGTLQAVLRTPIKWCSSPSLQRYCEDDRQTLTTNGAELSRFAVIDEGNELTFVWTLHHALYDGWSLSRIFEQVELVYQGQPPRTEVSYGHFIRYLHTIDLDIAEDFWRQHLAEAGESYPSLPSTDYHPISRQSRSSKVDLSAGPVTKTAVTTANLILAAYALVVAQCANTGDALFGASLSGRDVPVPGIADIVGPTLAVVPLQIRINRSYSVAEFLEDVQRQVLEIRRYQHIGIQRISGLSPEARAAANIQNLLTIQNQSDSETLACLGNIGIRAIQNEEQGFLDLALAVECVMGPDAIDISAQYDPEVVSEVQVESLLRQFKHTITALLDQSEQMLVKDLDLMPVDDLRQQQIWNHEKPETVVATIHELVEGQVLAQPDNIAISAFNVDLTYAQLNRLATKLAIHLTDTLGCRSEAKVVLCFTKSIWPIVAMLAVLKSGGVCISVNPDHPRRRLLDICDDTQSSIVLCDASKVEQFSDHVAHVVVVDGLSISNLSESHLSTWKQPAVRSTDASFVVYTSGSTGKPKGSILEHQALCTSLVAIGKRSNINAGSRTLQFSAYTFDAHILEIFGALIHGACVCVISDEDRLNNLTDAIKQREVNWSLLTPTVARLLVPESIPNLKTLILSGEPVTPKDVVQWADHLQLYNGLGPSECSILACLTPPLTTTDSSSNIGFPMGCHLWIVDSRCPDKLVPTGCIGEMVIEGPIIGREYINRPEATAAAFCYDLAWSRSENGQPRRFYRTGDLAKLNPDGSVTYIGRADFQIKIRGQRVELGEIEAQIRQRLPSGSEALVEYLPASGPLSEPTLISFLKVKDINATSALSSSKGTSLENETKKQSESVDSSKDWALQGSIAHTTVIELMQSLSDSLPQYMIPTGYVPISFIPSTPSGKTDRRRLRQYAQSLTREEMHMYGPQSQQAKPITDMEHELCSIWSRVLNQPADTLSIDDSFTSLGGDSITAMQTVAECRKQGIKITVSIILGKKSIRKIAPLCTRRTFIRQGPRKAENNTIGTGFDLSPVQQLYLSKESSGWTQFNQSFLLRLRQQVSVSELRHALETIVIRHAMLRARFTRNEDRGTWQQWMAPFEPDCYRLKAHSVRGNVHEIEPVVQKSGASLDIVRGPVFAVDLFNFKTGDPMLFMVAHHLVIDLVSWRVIWRELEEILRGGALSPVHSLSFERWCELQEVHSRSQATHLEEVLPIPTPPSEYSFWQVNEGQNTLGQTVEESFTLDAKSSGLILGSSNDALRTTPLDVLLGLLVLSFQTTFVERTVPSVFLEQHGRQVWETEEDIDISETVGWFTTMYPLHVPLSASTSAIEAIRLVKDLRHAVPDNGRPYFACRHLSSEGARQFQQHDPAEILFNFAGSFQQLEASESLLERESRLEVQSLESAPNNHRWAMIDVNVTVSHGVMKFSFDLHRQMAHLDRVRQWIHRYEHLLSTVPILLTEQQPTFTLSDFPLLKTSYAQLDDVIAQVGHSDNIRDTFPLSYFQKMLVEGNLETPPRHWDYVFVDLPSTIDLSRLRKACRRLANHFDSLRSVFVRSGDELLQVVLKNIEPQIDVGEYQSEAADVVEDLCRDDLLSRETRSLGQSFIRFMIVRTPTQTRLIMRLSHAQYDGMSLGPITSALASFYEGEAVHEATSFVEYIRHCQQHNVRGHEYWRSLLKGSELTIVPQIRHRTGQMGHETIRTNRRVPPFKTIPGVTPASIFSSACAILLAAMKGSSDVVFGRFVSGRAGLDAGVQDVVGACVNIVPVRAQVSDDHDRLLSSIQNQHIESITYETVGLDELKKHCTEWPADTSTTAEFPVIVQFRNYNVNLEAGIAGSSLHLTGWDQTLVHPFPSSLCMGAFPDKDGVLVSVSAGSAFCTASDIEEITEQLCSILMKFMQ